MHRSSIFLWTSLCHQADTQADAHHSGSMMDALQLLPLHFRHPARLFWRISNDHRRRIATQRRSEHNIYQLLRGCSRNVLDICRPNHPSIQREIKHANPIRSISAEMEFLIEDSDSLSCILDSLPGSVQRCGLDAWIHWLQSCQLIWEQVRVCRNRVYLFLQELFSWMMAFLGKGVCETIHRNIRASLEKHMVDDADA